MSTIAMFTTYAPSEGFGGPARAHHQRIVLEQAGHQVVHVVVQSNSERGNTRPTDFVALVERPWREEIDHIYDDVDLANRAARNLRLRRSIVDHLRRSNTELIVLEQPFLVELVTAVADELGAPVIYSSQNIEYQLRHDLERFDPSSKRAADRHQEVRLLELAAFELSDRVTAICPSDQTKIIEEFGRTSTLVPNGSTVADIALPVDVARQRIGCTTFAFAGSSYWPNVEGFLEIATPSLAFLPPTTKIDVAGSVGPQLLRHSRFVRHQSTNASRLNIRGFLPMSDLVAMMCRSRATIVPVFVGEGSNLKSADALACGAPVVMSRRATMGYEDIIEADPEGVHIVESPDEFRSELRRLVFEDPISEIVGIRRRELLRWDLRLDPLLRLVNELVAPPPI